MHSNTIRIVLYLPIVLNLVLVDHPAVVVRTQM
jgi:hypothetical protein